MSGITSPVTKVEWVRIREMAISGEISEAYEELAKRGFRYAELALGVVKGNSFSGKIALEFLDKSAEDLNRPLSVAELNQIRVLLAVAYLDCLGLQLGEDGNLVDRDIEADEAWQFHSEAFVKLGLGPDVWTLNTPFSLMNASARKTYWEASLDAAGDFPKEVMVGVAADLLIKQIAIQIFAPREAARARYWLERLHDLETYAVAADFAEQELEKVTSGLPNGWIHRQRNWLDDSSVTAALNRLENLIKL
jgi:hypothetical protein